MGDTQNNRQFSTIDDALEIVPGLEKLANILRELAKRKYPLAVRKGVMVNMTNAQKSQQIKGSGSTYFLDIQNAKTGSKYLRITQSRKSENEGEFERASIVIFPEDAKEFGQQVTKMLSEIK